ncbi:hypothetical protein cand_016740 [Cryptosporidium andersoni]|uniref:Uncharacterized protein n=1 Tax=Cryptosporidium andersoni TaxID=117008 RepID=A0A1J4MTE7_9CRYT|nr:hypothetical protein cand_016740 [Cryptosporidium andersoni]
MSKLNQFFEKKKHKTKVLAELEIKDEPLVAGLPVSSTTIPISTTENNINTDDWTLNTEIKDTISSSIISSGISNTTDTLSRKSGGIHMVVGVKTSKPDFDSNIWKSKLNETKVYSTNNNSDINRNRELSEKNDESNKVKESLKYNIRARLAAKGQKVELSNPQEIIRAMPTIAAAVATTQKVNQANQQYSGDREVNRKHEVFGQGQSSTIGLNSPEHSKNNEYIEEEKELKSNERDNKKDDNAEILKSLRECNKFYYNPDVALICSINIEESRQKYTSLLKNI